MKRVVLGFVLLAAGIFGFAGTAAACTEECVWVSPTCRRCLDVGVYNGQTCKNTVGPCGCFYVRNDCGSVTAAQSIGIEPENEAATCSAQPAEAAVFAELAIAAP